MPPARGHDVPVVADAAEGARALTAAVQTRHDPARAARIAEMKAEIRKTLLATVQPQMSFLEAIREVMPEDGILCD